MPYTKDELVQKIAEVGPWHYCHSMPYGLTTGTSAPDQLPYKMPGIIKGGAFQKDSYQYALDAGANSGYISMWLADKFGSQVDAIEGGEKFYQQLELVVEVKGYQDRIHPIKADLRNHSYPQDRYDLIVFLGTAHHVGEANLPDLFAKFHKAMKHDGEIVVQTKANMPMPKLLVNAGFRDVRKVDEIPGENRAAWVAWADKMKISFVQQCEQSTAQYRADRKTAEIVNALGYANTEKFKLDVLRALGETVLAIHWLRGTFYWLQYMGMIKFPNHEAERNFFRLYHLIEEYEARIWQVAPPRATLTLLQEFNESGEMSEDLNWMLENLDADEWGRVEYEAEGLDDIKDILARVTEARRRRKEEEK